MGRVGMCHDSSTAQHACSCHPLAVVSDDQEASNPSISGTHAVCLGCDKLLGVHMHSSVQAVQEYAREHGLDEENPATWLLRASATGNKGALSIIAARVRRSLPASIYHMWEGCAYGIVL